MDYNNRQLISRLKCSITRELKCNTNMCYGRKFDCSWNVCKVRVWVGKPKQINSSFAASAFLPSIVSLGCCSPPNCWSSHWSRHCSRTRARSLMRSRPAAPPMTFAEPVWRDRMRPNGCNCLAPSQHIVCDSSGCSHHTLAPGEPVQRASLRKSRRRWAICTSARTKSVDTRFGACC